MQVPYSDFHVMHDSIRDDLNAAYEKVMDSEWFIQGKQDTAFEEAFASFLGVRHCIGVGNGLDALRLILLALGIGRGDEVLVPANTFIASALAISYVGATPVLVDPDPETALITPEESEKHITSKTKAIMVVQLYGRVADMEGFQALAQAHHLALIEDAAQAHGAERSGRKAGSFGIAAGFSFYPGKNLGALGDGGAVVTDDDVLAQRVRALSNYGATVKYHHDELGVNSHLDELQAAFLSAKLPHLPAWTEERRRLGARYEKEITSGKLRLLRHDPGNVYHIFPVFCEDRDALQRYLEDQGIHTLIHYPIPIHLQKAYQSLGHRIGDFPAAESLAASELSIPLYPGMTEEAVDYVIAALNAF
ncbi:MAG: DegT/DnrJ/EryC1/StrS family aminotransferase [Clostridia bacterium]|nr:DegT/DnrJ/EryC1/StrS family aminotransferase [Clostridia bacterium]